MKIETYPESLTSADIGSFACREPMISEHVSTAHDLLPFAVPLNQCFYWDFSVMYAVRCSISDNVNSLLTRSDG